MFQSGPFLLRASVICLCVHDNDLTNKHACVADFFPFFFISYCVPAFVCLIYFRCHKTLEVHSC